MGPLWVGRNGSIGFLLVDALASQLGSRLRREAKVGLVYTLAFA